MVYVCLINVFSFHHSYNETNELKIYSKIEIKGISLL